MASHGLIFDVKHFSIHDGPGIRTTVFFKGCPLACAWCHNPESISPEPQNIYRPSRCIHCGRCDEGCYSGARETIGRQVSSPQLFGEIEKDRPFFAESGGGVTFSGGEPLLQYSFLCEILAMCRDNHINTVVDTSGYASRERMSGIADLCDLFLFDLKHVDPVKHLEFTGVDNRLIITNLLSIISSGCDVIVRVPVARGFNDDPQSIESIASFLEGLNGLKGVEPVECHGYAREKYRDLGIEFTDYRPRVGSVETFREYLAARGLSRRNS